MIRTSDYTLFPYWEQGKYAEAGSSAGAVVLAEGDVIALHDLPNKFRNLDLEGIATSSLRQALDDYEREYIRRSLTENNGNKEATAERLGIDLATLYRKLKKLRIETV